MNKEINQSQVESQTGVDERLTQLEKENNELKEEQLFLLAKVENKEKECQRQIKEIYKFSNKRFVSWVLDFLVNLEERALKAMRKDSEKRVQNHLSGLEMMQDNLWKNLEKEGLKGIEVKVGEEQFNGHYHEILEEVKNDELPEGTITEVVSKGYFFHEQVLKPSQVKVSKKSQLQI